jgi:hypothetical protein
MAQGGLICGPSANVVSSSKELQQILQDPMFNWLKPSTGPAARAKSALETLNRYPTLLTAGDHALLNGEIVGDFCTQAQICAVRFNHDLVLGLVPHTLVQKNWPDAKRTVLKFSGGAFCGSNLFAVMNPDGMKALSFWQQAEADRKHPWRIARRFGLMALLHYLLRRLSVTDTLKRLSESAGCSIGYVQLDHARAAVDVDTIEDQQLAENILSD